MIKGENDKSDSVRELVLARLEVMPSNFKLSVGNQGTFSKEELLDHVKKGDNIGRGVIEMQLNFIKALTTGKLIETINKNG
jgi:hypothetical protein